MSTPCDNIGGCQCRHKQAVPNTMQFVVRADCIVHFRRKYLKGLLSIPSHGRGARRPLGQSFRESVGPRPCLYHDDGDKLCQYEIILACGLDSRLNNTT